MNTKLLLRDLEMNETMLALVRQAMEGDKTALEGVIVGCQDLVFNLTRKIVNNVSDAEEMSQEVLIVISTKISDVKEPEKFFGWVRIMAINNARNFYKKKQKKSSVNVEDGYVDKESREIEPLDAMEKEEKRQEILQKMDELGQTDQEILDNFYLKGQKIQKIAKNMNIPLGTVKRRLFTARNRFRELMTAA